jgi:hypothetical protein
MDMNNPFFGFEEVRRVMARGGRGPTWGLLAAGLVMLAAGVWAQQYALVAVGAVAMLIGAAPIVSGRRSSEDAARLEDHAWREEAIVELAHRIAAMSAGDAMRARPQLVAEVAADPDVARISRETCLQRAATDPLPDVWLDAAGAIADARADAPVREVRV